MIGRTKIAGAVVTELDEKQVVRAIEELHPVFRKLFSVEFRLAREGAVCLIHGELEVYLLLGYFYKSTWVSERRVEWLQGMENLSKLFSAEAVLKISMVRHNPASLEIRVGYGFKRVCIASVTLLSYDDCLHLEAEEDISKIKEKVLRRVREWKRVYTFPTLLVKGQKGEMLEEG
jgi:hypothetical protein